MDYSEIGGNLFDGLDTIDGGMAEAAENLLSDLSIRHRENSYGEYYFSLPRKTSNIIKLFKKLRELKNSVHSDPFMDLELTTGKITESDVHELYDKVFENLKKMYEDAISTSSSFEDGRSHEDVLRGVIDRAYLS